MIVTVSKTVWVVTSDHHVTAVFETEENAVIYAKIMNKKYVNHTYEANEWDVIEEVEYDTELDKLPPPEKRQSMEGFTYTCVHQSGCARQAHYQTDDGRNLCEDHFGDFVRGKK